MAQREMSRLDRPKHRLSPENRRLAAQVYVKAAKKLGEPVPAHIRRIARGE